MARKSGFVRRRGAMVRDTVWFQFLFTRVTMAAASTAVLSTSLNAAALALRPFTIVRTRGVVGFNSDQVGATESYQGSIGMCVVSDQASGIGVTAVPTPQTDLGSDLWFLHESGFGRFEFVSGVGVLEVGSNMDRVVDSKAMRKVDIGQDLVIVQETSAISNGMILTFQFRMLVKVH